MPNTEVRGTKKSGAALLMKTKQESGKFLPKQRSFQSNHFVVCFFLLERFPLNASEGCLFEKMLWA